MSVLVETSFGDIVIDLETEKFPTASYNFLKLCKLKHYNNALFFKVQKDFVTEVKTKQPTTVWQELGEDRPYFKDQVDMEAKVNALGLVGTSNLGQNKNNSQFFITLTRAHLSSLNGKHTVFGKVEQGFDILKKINQTYVDEKARPQMNIRIMHTFVLDDPFEDPPKFKIPESPKLQRDSHRLQAIEHLEMLEKYSTQKDILDATRKEKAKKQAITLEMLGQLPDANVKPPQNILFVCKLNPITQQRDLQIIFSRFGPIKSVQVVRDWKTGQSLQYGFIQFESQKSCQEAYLKMDNVVIDDRRIKVDFSQSVSKLMPKMKSNQAKTYQPNSKDKSKEIVSNMRMSKNYYGDKQYNIVAKDTNKYQSTNDGFKRTFQQQQERLKKKQQRQEKQIPDKRRNQSQSESSSSQRQRKVKKQKKEKKQKKQKDRKQKKQKKEKKQKKDKKYRQRSYSKSSQSERKRSRSRSKQKKKSKSKYDRYDK